MCFFRPNPRIACYLRNEVVPWFCRSPDGSCGLADTAPTSSGPRRNTARDQPVMLIRREVKQDPR